MCDIELILRNPASEVENVWGAQIMWNWIGMHARLYWLSQIHFHFLKFTFNYLEITFTFFKLAIFSEEKRSRFFWQSNLCAVHAIWALGLSPKLSSTHHLICSINQKMHVQTDLMKCERYLGVESNFQYHLLTSWESNLWWVWTKTSNWVLFPRSWMALKLCQCKSEMAKTLCIWEKSPASLRIKWVG